MYTSRMCYIVGRAWANSAWHEGEKSRGKQWHEGGKSNNSLVHAFTLMTYVTRVARRRMCTWRVFTLVWSPVPQLLASFSGPKTGRGYSAVVLDRSQALPSSLSLFCARLLGGACEQSYSSLARLPQQVHEQHVFLSVLSWAYSACVFFSLLFQWRGTLSRSILRFSFKLLHCLWGLSRVTSRTRLCYINDPKASLCELAYQPPFRFTSETWL